MNEHLTGLTIKKSRESNKLTQSKLADLLGVSNKTISKWENGKGYPDIEMIDSIAKLFKVSITELLNGETIFNTNVSANLLKTKFYVCPICGNIITTIGESFISCHGITLKPCIPKEDPDLLKIEKIENEYYVLVNHQMEKSDYISFIAAVAPDCVQLKKLYPEASPEAYFRRAMVKYIYYYSNKEGLFFKKL